MARITVWTGLIVLTSAARADAQGLFHEGTLTASTPAAGDSLGMAVATDGSALLVGAVGHDEMGIQDSGAVYTFFYQRRQDPNPPQVPEYLAGLVASLDVRTVWEPNARLVASDPIGGAWFGSSLAVDGEFALIGAPFARDAGGWRTGAVYVFSRAPGRYVEVQKLTPPDGGPMDEFGCSVAIRGSTALIGARKHGRLRHPQTGAAYVFTRSGDAWQFARKLTYPQALTGDAFGASVALDDSLAAIGIPGDDYSARIDAGSVAVFVTADWGLKTVLRPEEPTSRLFGHSIAVHSGRLAVGAPGLLWDQGVVHVYRLRDHPPPLYDLEMQMAHPFPAPSPRFGWSVALAGESLVVGAPKGGAPAGGGAVFLYSHTESGWGPPLTPYVDSESAHMDLGWSVAVGGAAMATGAPKHDVGEAPDAGAAFVDTALQRCYADCDRTNGQGVLDSRDWQCFMRAWIAQEPYADCDGDVSIDFNDVICFYHRWWVAQVLGCPP